MNLRDIELRHVLDAEALWRTLLDIYADVRAPLLHLPHYSVERYGERLARHADEPGWEAVIGYDAGEPVGYAYANTLAPDDRWWNRMIDPLPAGVTDARTVALKEIMVRSPWRGTGTARRIHDELLSHRTEPRVTLLVNPLAGDGKVQALYETWGYRAFNRQQPSVDSPALTAMIRDTHGVPATTTLAH